MRIASLAQLWALDGRTDMADHNVAMMLQNNSDIVDGETHWSLSWDTSSPVSWWPDLASRGTQCRLG